MRTQNQHSIKPEYERPDMAETKPREAAPSAGGGSPNEKIDADIAEDMAERQQWNQAGRETQAQRLRDHGSESPKLSGGDVDAAWDSGGSGEETVGGDTSTPGQDMVDEIGKGAGLTYQDDEPMNYGKVQARDQNRWELNPASAEETDDDTSDQKGERDLDVLGRLDGAIEEESLEVLDVDDLAEDEEEAEDIAEYGLDDIDALEDDDQGDDSEADEDDEVDDD
jgi:hypothetical protein